MNYIKQCLGILTNPITALVNQCYDKGSFPDMLKTARIVPIFKNGDSLSPANYQPISILDDFSKLTEQCIFERFDSFANKHKLISDFQFGFQKQLGTLSAAACFLDMTRTSLDASNKNICEGIFLDVTKAFDSISHDPMMRKLHRLGFRGKAYDLIHSFLTDRQQYI